MATGVNRYHLDLSIPVEFKFPRYSIPDESQHYHCRFHKQDMNSEFVKWIHSLGLFIIAGEYFYTPPFRTLEPHSDSSVITDAVKLNWMEGGEGSMMEWYELKPGVPLKEMRTGINTTYGYALKKDILLKHEAKIGKPSLVNVGQIHGIRNGPEPRHVACVILGQAYTRERLMWDAAEEIFKNYVV